MGGGTVVLMDIPGDHHGGTVVVAWLDQSMLAPGPPHLLIFILKLVLAPSHLAPFIYLVIILTPPRRMGAPFLIATSLPKALLLREAGSSPSPQLSQTGQWRFQSVRQVREQRKRKRKQGNWVG